MRGDATAGVPEPLPVVERTHDKQIYLHESRYDDPKELFKLVGALARQSGALAPGRYVCDFGCAAGELLHYFSRLEPAAVLRGFDVVPELIDKARQNVPA